MSFYKYLPNFTRSLFILVIFSCSGTAWSEAMEYPEKMIFRNIMADRDIGIGEIEAIVQDGDGFLWLGARNGLLRFDGYEFLQVDIEVDTEDASRPTKVSQTADLYIDSSNRMWASTRWGMYLYDREREILSRIKSRSGETIDFNQEVFNRSLEIMPDVMLFATYGGLIVYDVKSEHAKRIQKGEDPSKGPIGDRINDMFIADDGRVWMGADGGVSVFDPKTELFEHIVPYKENPSAPKENSIQAIEMDKNGHVWAAASNGIYRIVPSTKEVVRYVHDPADPFSISDDIQEDVYLDSKGILWIGTDRGGLNYYHYETDSFRSFKAAEGQKGAISSNITRRIYEDSNNDLWVGTYPSGLNFHDRSSSAITVYKHEANDKKSLAADLVTDIKEDAKGNFWVATDGGGPNYFDRQTGQFKNFLGAEGEEDRVASKKMLCGLIDSDGDVWFGTWDAGVFRYNPEKDRFDQLPLDTSQAGGNPLKNVFVDTAVWDIYEDSQKRLWIATHNVGLVRYNKHTGEFYYYSQDLSRDDALVSNLVWTLFEDSKGRFWAGTVEGLSVMDREAETFKSYRSDASVKGSLKNDFINAIAEDSKGRVWIGTNNGLHLFNEETETFTLYDKESHGFSDNGIRSIELDEKNQLWLGTNNGITVFEPDSGDVKNYQRFNGEKIGGISTGGSLLTSKGEIVLGGPGGLRIYNVNQLRQNENPPPVVLTEFSIYTKPIAIGAEDGFLDKSINLADQITLTHKESMIGFNYAALNFRDSDKNQYAYKLEGFDDDWREVGTKRQAVYTNLSAGNYTFRVRGSNNDGVWNEEGASIKIRQLPPPWLTWWAKTIYALIIIGIVARFIQQQHKKRKAIEEQNRILEMRVAERTAELRAKNDDIQSMLSNMRQGLFTIDTDGTVHPEYSLHLETIFESSKLAGKNAYELLFAGAKSGSNVLNQCKESMFSIIGEDEMFFDFNSHGLIDEYDIEIDHSVKSLSLDWNPIIDEEGVVKKLMVSVRDVTLLKQMESEAASKKRELDIISQLLNLPSQKYRKFIDASVEFLDQNQALIEKHSSKDSEVIAALFRNMHTIKGNCRTYGFTHFSDVVHEVETLYSDLSNNDELEWDQQKLLADIGRVRDVMEEYEHVYLTVLGRSKSDSSRNNNGFWLNEEAIVRMNQSIDKAIKENPGLCETGSLSEVRAILEHGISLSLEDTLKDVVSSLPSIAEQLNKAAPVVDIHSNGVRILKEHQDTINNVFAHLLRNCLDHGIETPEQRKELGKPEAGTIAIDAEDSQDFIELTVTDDGQGLNVQRLYQIGVTKARWAEGDAVKTADICEMIFESGVSTKEAVTDISGRGVGMNAVREFIRNLGGDVSLHLADKDANGTDSGDMHFAAVKFVVKLPSSVCVTPSRNKKSMLAALARKVG